MSAQKRQKLDRDRSLSVRAAVPGDANSIAVVHAAAARDAYRDLMPREYLTRWDVESLREVWNLIPADTDWPRRGTFVAEDNGQIVGFVRIGPASHDDASEDVGAVKALYVLSEMWGMGAGRVLMQQAVATLREAHFNEATLWVLGANARARRFYEAAGWFVDGTERTDELRGFPVREIRYRCLLGQTVAVEPGLSGEARGNEASTTHPRADVGRGLSEQVSAVDEPPPMREYEP
jgi:GNAT superfamily N-acetyltransferase